MSDVNMETKKFEFNSEDFESKRLTGRIAEEENGWRHVLDILWQSQRQH